MARWDDRDRFVADWVADLTTNAEGHEEHAIGFASAVLPTSPDLPAALAVLDVSNATVAGHPSVGTRALTWHGEWTVGVGLPIRTIMLHEGEDRHRLRVDVGDRAEVDAPDRFDESDSEGDADFQRWVEKALAARGLETGPIVAWETSVVVC